MNVDDLPPGRLMDALVAEKVMGFLRWSPVIRDGNFFLATRAQAKEEWRSDSLMPASEDACAFTDFDRFVPRYSTDIAAAWEVVERIVSKGGRVAIDCLGKDDAKTAPFTICLAVLKALMDAQKERELAAREELELTCRCCP